MARQVDNSRIIVKKFGGTSVMTQGDRSRIRDLVLLDLQKELIPVLVVSAMGRQSAPYATDTLIGLYRQIHQATNHRDLDLLMSCGEIISATLISATLNAAGLVSRALTGFHAGIVTDNTHGGAEVLAVNPEYIEKLLSEGIIPVISGFQGISVEGEITTLGRGGSDTTAALIGEALKAQKVEIYTDVEGVMTADPTIVENATILSGMTYEEMYEMARHGAKVLDFNAVDVAKRSGLKLVIKNSSSSFAGTTVTDRVLDERVLTAITSDEPWTQYQLENLKESFDDKGFMDELSRRKISIDMINFFEASKYFIIDSRLEDSLDEALEALGIAYDKRKDCAKVTVIGHRIHGVPGIMRRIVNALEGNGITILQTSDSSMTISCLIRNDRASDAVNYLHQAFDMEKNEG
ncbi:MAG: hypothetical protein AVO33_10570 [delta proteobacterium ML8_F1]|nr:MAG: hypothetical protein AVO33_10570 [delta proteobacterium ML8_F1]